MSTAAGGAKWGCEATPGKARLAAHPIAAPSRHIAAVLLKLKGGMDRRCG